MLGLVAPPDVLVSLMRSAYPVPPAVLEALRFKSAVLVGVPVIDAVINFAVVTLPLSTVLPETVILLTAPVVIAATALALVK